MPNNSPSRVKVTNTREIKAGGAFGSLTVDDLRTLIKGVDGSCKISLHESRGGQMEPTTWSVTIADVMPERITRGVGDRPIETL